MEIYKKIEKMHLLFGKLEGHKCKECNRLVYDINWNGKKFYKCENYGISNAESTDWRLSYEACGMMNKVVDKPVVKMRIPKVEEKPKMEGEITLFDYIKEN